MIPLISFGKLIATIFSGFVSYYSYRVWQREKENKAFEYFFKSLLCTTAVFICFVPLPLINNLYIIQGIFYLIDSLMVLAAAYFGSMFLVFLGWERFQKILLRTITLIIFISMLFYIKYFNPAFTYHFQFFNLQFIGWAPELPPLLRIPFVGIVGLIALIFIPPFLIKTFSLQDPYIKIRAIFFIFGLTTLGLAATFCLVYGSLKPTSFLKELIHIAFSTSASIFFFLFIFYKRK